MKKLTHKQSKFCLEFVACGNAAEAYRRVYNTSRMSQRTAYRKALELKENGIVAAYIDELRNAEEERIKERYRIDHDKLMRQLSDIAFLDIGKLFDDDGNLLEPNQMHEEARRAIASFEVITNRRSGNETNSRTFKIKLADRLSAIDKLAKHIGFYSADNSQQDPEPEDSKSGLPDYILEMIKPPVTREYFLKERQQGS